MSLNYLNRVLQKILASPQLEVYQKYRVLLECWQGVVTPQELLNTRLLYVSNRVLFVATSSAAWAQNLSFKRYLLLQKLNDGLSEKLTDIRFSPAQWHKNTELRSEVPSFGLENHPSFIGNDVPVDRDSLPSEKTPQGALEGWLQAIKKRSQDFPLCPRCQAPTPPGELERWQVCSICASKQWLSLK
jgi:predicted nucleic acid-binding Zn ribbon protein